MMYHVQAAGLVEAQFGQDTAKPISVFGATVFQHNRARKFTPSNGIHVVV